jgi:hypothetical protein
MGSIKRMNSKIDVRIPCTNCKSVGAACQAVALSEGWKRENPENEAQGGNYERL